MSCITMGMVSIVADILKFPWPLFPKYKKTFPVGKRFSVGGGNSIHEINLPPSNKYELLTFVYGASEYNDGDAYSLYKNDDVIFSRIYTKELGQVIELCPVTKIDPLTDTIKFVFHNASGISKVVWIDLMLTTNKPVLVSDV